MNVLYESASVDQKCRFAKSLLLHYKHLEETAEPPTPNDVYRARKLWNAFIATDHLINVFCYLTCHLINAVLIQFYVTGRHPKRPQ